MQQVDLCPFDLQSMHPVCTFKCKTVACPPITLPNSDALYHISNIDAFSRALSHGHQSAEQRSISSSHQTFRLRRQAMLWLSWLHLIFCLSLCPFGSVTLPFRLPSLCHFGSVTLPFWLCHSAILTRWSALWLCLSGLSTFTLLYRPAETLILTSAS